MQIKCDKKITLTPNQFYENKELYLEDAVKLLSVQAFARTTSVEALNGEIRTGYCLTIRALYINQDGMVEKKEELYDLASTIRAGVSVNSHVIVNTSVIGVEYHGVQNLKVRVMLEQKGCYLQDSSFEPCDKENICYKKKGLVVRNIFPFRSAEFIIDKTENIKNSVGQILGIDAVICAKNVSCATDLCEIEGIANVYFTHLVDGELKGQNLKFPFSYELLAEGIKEGDEVELFFTPVSTTLALNEENGGVEASLQILVEIKGYSERNVEIDYPLDAYSKEHEIALEYGEVVLHEKTCSIKTKENFSTSLSLGEIADVVEIINIGTPWVGASNVSANSSITVDGVICSEILLKRENGEYARVLAEIPYSFDLKEEATCSNDLDVIIDVVDVGARVRFGSSLEIFGEISIRVNGHSEVVVSYLEKVEAIGEKTKNDAVISVYLVGQGETLFDCAKALQSDEEELLALNPDLDLPLKEGDKVLLYRPL